MKSLGRYLLTTYEALSIFDGSLHTTTAVHVTADFGHHKVAVVTARAPALVRKKGRIHDRIRRMRWAGAVMAVFGGKSTPIPTDRRTDRVTYEVACTSDETNFSVLPCGIFRKLCGFTGRASPVTKLILQVVMIFINIFSLTF